MAVLLQINSGIVGSTGTIMLAIDRYAREAGFETYMASVNNKSSQKDYPANHIAIGTIPEKILHRKLSFYTGNAGGYSYFATKRLLKKIDRIRPDIVHLHNLHWDYINLELLFDYLKSHSWIKVVWTLHDCWAYTGHCPYYDMTGCDRWQTECRDCTVYKNYPPSNVDNSTKMHRRKKKWFLGVPNMTLVTPSKWLSGEVKKSFLKDYPARVISNGIDTGTFSRRENDIREKYGLQDKFVVFGSAYSWSARKGFDCFVKLSEMLDRRFAIILVGGFSAEQEAACDAHGIIHLPRTASKDELAALYSASDVFFNPTREEMFGLVNIEAQACGTPVITFDSGGSPECIGEGCGIVIPKDDLNAAAAGIMQLLENQDRLDRQRIREWAVGFEESKTYAAYIELYQELTADNAE